MRYLEEHKVEDARSNLRAFAWLNFLLAFCLVVPDIVNVTFDYHLAVLLLQGGLVLLYLRSRPLQTRVITTGIFLFVLLTTVHEAGWWASQLDGVIHGGEIGGKGAPFAFVFQSPPYLYPVIRIGSLGLFVPILRTFGLSPWDDNARLGNQ
ncbi:hypothetical protein [Lewinella sp. IMCC34191]|uniref:hypothetical protein n=1 Tax=Lewinella sp. IMCC34191 TaxID=2259172 RepID=UPI000E21E064|nr:hypothetical protein [Lewinella sp. IMCC34191]